MKTSLLRLEAPRIVIAATLTAIGCLYFLHVEHSQPRFYTDLDVQVAGARAIVDGRDPYGEVGPGKHTPWPFALAYPMPTLITLVPLTSLGLPAARLVFVAVTSFLYLYAIGGLPGRWRYIAVLSKPYQVNLLLAQWGFVFAAAWVLPALAAFAIVKPQIGAVVVAARLRRQWMTMALIGGGVLLIASFVIMPTWPREWISAASTDPNRRIALTRPGGFLLVLAALKWRRPEARLLLILSIIPQTLGFYDAVLLFFVPASAVECIALVALSHFAYLLTLADPTLSLNALVVSSGSHLVTFVYVPALLMILRRPNTGSDLSIVPDAVG